MSYQVYKLEELNFPDHFQLEALLNTRSSEGWELVAFTQSCMVLRRVKE